MKTIGLLGGTSWPSTMEYYKILNMLAQNTLGGHHSAKIILLNIDRKLQASKQSSQSAAGILSQYANPEMIEQERGVWQRASVEKYT